MEYFLLEKIRGEFKEIFASYLNKPIDSESKLSLYEDIDSFISKHGLHPEFQYSLNFDLDECRAEIKCENAITEILVASLLYD